MTTKYNWLLPQGKHSISPDGRYHIHYVVRCYRNGKRHPALDFTSEDYGDAMTYRREMMAEERDRQTVEAWIAR